MTPSSLHITAAFGLRQPAQQVLDNLVECGLPRETLDLVEPAEPPTWSTLTLADIVANAAFGVATALVLAGLTHSTLLLLTPDLLDEIAWPLAAGLLLLLAGLGALAGVAVGAGRRGDYRSEGRLARLVHALVTRPRVLLVARARSLQEAAVARAVLQRALLTTRPLVT